MEKRLYGLCMVVDVGQLGVLLGGRKRGKEEGERRGGKKGGKGGGLYSKNRASASGSLRPLESDV